MGCEIACENIQPMIGWTLCEGAVLVPPQVWGTRGLPQRQHNLATAMQVEWFLRVPKRKDSHSALPSGIIYRPGTSDRSTLG